MQRKKQKEFVDAILPVVQTLKFDYLQGVLRNDEGIVFGCSYCDLYPKEHSDDCLAKTGKELFQKILEIKEKRFHVNDDSNEEIQYREMFYLILNDLIRPNMDYFIPVDFSDESNKNIGCPCIHDPFAYKRKHSNHCLVVKVAKAIKELYG